MRKALLLSILALCAAPAAAADSGRCDAVPFTLGKPVPTAEKGKTDRPATEHVKQAKPAKKAEAKAQPKPALLAPCKTPKKKKSG